MLKGCTSWPQEFARVYREKGYWEDITLWEMLERSINKYADKEALVFNDVRISYRELGDKVTMLAYRFQQIGLKPLDRVVIQLPNIPEFVYTFFALVRIGVIPVMALPAHRQTEIKHFIKFSEAVAYFIPDIHRKFDYRVMGREMQQEFPHLRHVFVAGEAEGNHTGLMEGLSYEADQEILKTSLLKSRPDPAEVTLMLLSGGTTGLPKLIPRTHNDYVLNCRESGRVAEYSENSVYLAILPMAHNFTLASPGILAAFYYGGKVVISPGIDAELVFPLIEKERVTITGVAVPVVSSWLNSPVPARYDLSSWRVLQNGGARLAPELRKRVMEQFGCRFQEVFGTAEGLLNMGRLDDPEDLVLNSSGAPVMDADEIKVVDDFGNEVADGEPGELLCRGPYTIRGYYNATEINKNAFTEDGFYHMGDIVRKIGRYLYAEGRKRDLINRGGEKISCEEVENFIYAYPKVKEVCLVGMPDEIYGERACAFLVPKPGETITFQELIDFLLLQEIAKFKLPERLEVVDSLPISAAGKILKRALKEIITEKLQAEKQAVPQG